MKKVLGIAKKEVEVPEWLDREILATAALRARSFRERRRVKVMLSSAAALMLVAFGAWQLHGYLDPPRPVRDVAVLSQGELLSMSDFSAMEQERFSMEQLVASYEPNADYAI